MSLSPTNANEFIYSISSMNLASNSISRLEIVSLTNIYNISGAYLYYDEQYHTLKYNLKVILGSLISTAVWWNYNHDNGSETKLS